MEEVYEISNSIAETAKANKLKPTIISNIL